MTATPARARLPPIMGQRKRHEFSDGFARLGNDDLLARRGRTYKPRKMLLGFMNIDGPQWPLLIVD